MHTRSVEHLGNFECITHLSHTLHAAPYQNYDCKKSKVVCQAFSLNRACSLEVGL
jgi:hypothetical protein